MRRMQALLGIDLGTTGCKAAVYGVDGRFLGACTFEYPLIKLSPEFVEQDADGWWALTQQAIREAVARAGIPGEAVQALSVSSQGISFVPIDAAGHCLRPAINWLDTRASAEAEEVRAALGDEALYALTGKRPSAAYVLPKLLWLRRHEPEILQRTARFLLAHDLLLYRLCGATLTDYSLAGGALLLDLRTLSWSRDLLARFDLDAGQLPDLAWAGTRAGDLDPAVAADLGLRPGTAVVVGGQDQKCAALGAGIRPGRATVSLGTASAISAIVDRPLLDPGRRVPTFPFVAPGYWDLEGVVSTAGAALKWVHETFFPAQSYDTLDGLAAASPPGAGGVRFYPHLAGATSPLWEAGARGAFTGLSLASGAGDIVRAVLEGIAYQVRANLEVIEPLAGVQELALFGGGARSPLWAQIISDVVGLPVYATETVDVANWGACVLAGVGAGLFPSALAPELCSALTLCAEPDTARAARYAETYTAYARAEGRLLDL
ncbi:MAG: xylulokinase [Anaerolineae bacterium]